MCANTTIGVLLFSLHVALQPVELLVTEGAHSACLEIDDVDEPDEVHAGLVEAYQPAPFVFLPKRSR